MLRKLETCLEPLLSSLGVTVVSKLECWSCGVQAGCQGSECWNVRHMDAGVKDVKLMCFTLTARTRVSLYFGGSE